MDRRDAEQDVLETRDRYLDKVQSAANGGASETLVDDYRIEALTRLDDVQAGIAAESDDGLQELVESTRREVNGQTW
ncbi:MAG TPA: hypothetical protein VHK06_07475 [Candidatus Limnocylindria bacterium]|nr:hypothetical protein [Candidatus Limnocylindria bacterium]